MNVSMCICVCIYKYINLYLPAWYSFLSKLHLFACLFWYLFHVRVSFCFFSRCLVIFDFLLLIKNESLKANRELLMHICIWGLLTLSFTARWSGKAVCWTSLLAVSWDGQVPREKSIYLFPGGLRSGCHCPGNWLWKGFEGMFSIEYSGLQLCLASLNPK